VLKHAYRELTLVAPANAMSTNTHAACAFWRLPAELRLHIYGYIIPEVPFSQPRTQYRGVVFACSQMRAEIEPAIVKTMRDVLADATKEGVEIWQDDLDFGTPKTISELENLTVVGHLTWEQDFDAYKDKHKQRHHPILKLLEMHFCKITIKSVCKHENSATKRHPVWNSWIVLPFTTGLDPCATWLTDDTERAPAVRVLEYDCSATLACPRARRLQFAGTYFRNITEARIWKIDMRKDERGSMVIVRFERMMDASTVVA
jgi:hypothetical protein